MCVRGKAAGGVGTKYWLLSKDIPTMKIIIVFECKVLETLDSAGFTLLHESTQSHNVLAHFIIIIISHLFIAGA